MAKGIYIGVGGAVRKVINVWTIQGGVLKQKCSLKGNVLGVIKDFIIYKLVDKSWEYAFADDYAHSVTVDSNGNVFAGDMNYHIVKLSSNGEIIWSFTYGYSNILNLVADANNLYVAASTRVRKLNSENHSQVWEYIDGDIVHALAIDSSSYIYLGGYSNYVTKLNTSGSVSWKYNFGNTVFCISIDPNKNVYAGGSPNKIVKLNSNGGVVWSYTNCDGSVQGIAIDSSGNVFAGDSFGSLVKLTSSGVKVWKYDNIIPITDVKVDIDGNVYISDEDGLLTKLSTSMDVIWQYQCTASINHITLDSNKNVYVADDSHVVTKLIQS